MGKDREGNFHPPKGRPSGEGKQEEQQGIAKSEKDSLENYLELAEKYTEGPDELPANVRVRHPNRNVDKAENRRETRSQSRKKSKGNQEAADADQTKVRPEELPGILTKELFAELAAFKSSYCVSIFMQTHRAGVEGNEQADITTFKSALQQVAASMRQKDFDAVAIQKMLEPGHELLRDEKFWRNMNQGLAVFVADGFFKFVKMPETPAIEMIENSSFYLKPLVNAMTVKEYFYLLVISKKQARFFKADNFGMYPVEIPEMPNGVEDVVHLEEKEDQKLFRTDTAGGGRGASFHGHGAGKPDEKENIAMYLEEVDETLWEEVLHNENVPLVLCGVDYHIPIFRSVSGYNNIWPEHIKGNHEYDDLKTLYIKAREIMEPFFRERTKKALENYGNQSATALTSLNVNEVIPGAHYGRIWHLFVRPNQHLWGTFDAHDNQLIIHAERQEGDECLIDKAVVETILHGGDVHFLAEEDMPSTSPVAALFRY